MLPKEVGVSSPELESLSRGLANVFVQRRDLYARQFDDGHYVCVPRPLTDRHLLAHLRGDLTLGTYILDSDSRARFLVFDADDEIRGQQLACMASALRAEGVPAYLEASRRGLHLWFFFPQPLPARHARGFGLGLQARFELEGIEMFPKQDRLREGPGSLIRLPFGIHRKTGQRYGFLTPELQPLAATLTEQVRLLSQPQTVSDPAIQYYRSYWPTPKELPEDRPIRTSESSGTTLSGRIKGCISVYDFIGHYVQLTPNGRGLCPFHEDRVHSFAVNLEGNYWHCFAGCGGGSIIDFWMKKQNCDFVTAVRELSRILL